MSQFGFHPIIDRWFAKTFAGPTEPQRRGWPLIAAGRHTLIAAPTGSGKTLTAFLAVIDRLVREGLVGTLKDEMRVVYISPLRALSNDMQKNLNAPLAEIAAEAALAGVTLPPIRVGLRTGDTSTYERAKLVKNPPHILVTTPESLFLMLTAEKGRAALSTVDTVIVDEIHALARDKRGSHLALSLERLEYLVQQRFGERGGVSPPSLSGEDSPRRHGGTEGEELSAISLQLSGSPASGVALAPGVNGQKSSDSSSSSLSPASDAAFGEDSNRGERAGVSGPSSSDNPLTLTLSPTSSPNQKSNPIVGERGPEKPSSSSVPLCLRGESSPERLRGLTPPGSLRRLQRIGLSATQKPIDRMARFLVGAGDGPLPVPIEPPPREKRPAPDGPGCHEEVDRAGQIASREQPAPISVDCAIVDVGHQRELDLAIETPESELGAVCSHELWAEVNARIVDLINTHRSTVIFVNTRRMAERVTFQLTELLGEDAVSSHHGSLSAPIRLKTEQRLKAGELKAVVATASLELGIDIGYIDLVIQLGSPRSIATFLQRIGRSGHARGLIPKGRLFALTRDELLEAMGLIRAIRAGRLDVTPIPTAPLDILAQQIVAEVSTGEWNTDELYDRFRRAEPYRTLRRSHFDQVVKFISEGVTDTGGRVHVLLHHDHVQRRLRARPAARLTTINNGGAIPETDVLRVIVEPEHTVVGSVDEEFGIESMAGDVFLLGNTSWQIEGVRGNDLLVHDAHGAPPTIPFWRGEGPGRTIELSEEVSRVRREIEERVKGERGGVSPLVLSGEGSPGRHGDSEREEELSAISSQPSVKQASRVASAPGVSGQKASDATSGSLSPANDDSFGVDSNRGERAGVRGPNSSDNPLTLTLSHTSSPNHNSEPIVGERGPKDSSFFSSSSVSPCLRGESSTSEVGRTGGRDAIAHWLVETTSCSLSAAHQMVTYVAAQQAAVGLVPTQDRVIFERFFDETGGMQLVVHAPFGARINRAWGLAMRKRFCRSFDFELQATADDDGFILSLGPQHSFPIESLFPMLRADNVQNLLEQAILAVPMFQLRWRWNATRALLVARQKNGKKVPPALQRFRSDDLLTAVFPKLTGCQENIVGDHVLPDHPLVEQTMYDCLNEALDIEGLLDVLGRVERGEIEFLARDTREPSPFSYELLNANPYAFLDGGEVQERRARAVQTRRSLSVNDVRDLGRLNPEAIEQVVEESRPVVRNADELHDVLLSRIVLPVERRADRNVCSTGDWRELFEELRASGRAAAIALPNGAEAWVCAERWPAARLVYKQAVCDPPMLVPSTVRHDWEEIEALVSLVRGAVEFCGPVTAEELAEEMSLGVSQVFSSLEALEGEGTVLRGRFRAEGSPRRHGDTEGEEELSAINRQPSANQASRAASAPGVSGRKALDSNSCSLSPANDLAFGEDSNRGERGPESVADFSEIGGTTLGVEKAFPFENTQLEKSFEAHDSTQPADAQTPISEKSATLSTIEWCHRRLLSRIHRLTVAGLRKEIEAVDVPTFVRFLTRHQMVWPESRRTGSNALYDVITQLQGIDIAATAWEADVLPLRVQEYRKEWLDELSLTGEVTWGRLYPPARDPDKSRPNASLTRVAPVSICLREDLPWLLATAAPTQVESLGSQAQEVLQLLQQHGALFATDLLQHCRMLPSQLDDVLGELVTRGWVTADGFSGLRSLIRESDSSGSRHAAGRGPKVVRHRRNATVGRWTLWRKNVADFSEIGGTTLGGEKTPLLEKVRLEMSFEARKSRQPLDAHTPISEKSATLPSASRVASAPGVSGQKTSDANSCPLSPTSTSNQNSEPIVEERGPEYPSSSAVPPCLRGEITPPERTGWLTPPRSPVVSSDRLAPDLVEQWAWQLLRRWGVIFRDLLNREPGAPRWWELLQVYRRLEARGEIRGGRFIAGVAGEQFALGDTIRELRLLKGQPTAGELVIVSACDPLNLIGILNNDARIPSQASNRVALFNGIAVAAFQGEVQLLPTCPKSLAPFISSQLRTGKTMAVAIPKGTGKAAETVLSKIDEPTSLDAIPLTGQSPLGIPTVPHQKPLTPVEKQMVRRKPPSPSRSTIPRPRIS